MAYLQMRNITKVFGSVVANDHVDLESMPCWAKTARGKAR